MHCFLMIGCNIPIFIVGKKKIQAIKPSAEGHHYDDKDDVLDWSLQPLDDFYDVHASHRKAVVDRLSMLVIFLQAGVLLIIPITARIRILLNP